MTRAFNSSGPIEDYLFSKDFPPLDLLVRTSEHRLSDFQLWQSTGSCYLAFVNTLWPQFSFFHLVRVILSFQLYSLLNRK